MSLAFSAHLFGRFERNFIPYAKRRLDSIGSVTDKKCRTGSDVEIRARRAALRPSRCACQGKRSDNDRQ